MNETRNKFLLSADDLTAFNLRQPEFKYSAFGPFTKNKEKTQKFKEKEDLTYI